MAWFWRLIVIVINLKTNGLMPYTLKRIILLLLLLGPLLGAKAQNMKNYDKLVGESEQFIDQKIKSDSVVGFCVAMIAGDSVILEKGYGLADKEHNVPMTIHTVVNIGSVTKTFTALALMQLYGKGIIDINQPLINYFPEFHPMSTGNDLRKVTVRSVITHTSGIQSDILKNSDLNSGKYTDVVSFINKTYLIYPPGMVGLYSNSGYNILGNLIKVMSKQDYPVYVHRYIFDALGMSSSGFATDPLVNRAKLYAKGKVVTEYELRDIASGGIYSNIDDMVKYARALMDAYNGKTSPLISPGTVRQMFALQNAAVPIETNKKGLGWFMFKNDSAFAVFHSGSAGFAHANILMIPGKRFAVITLTNTAEGGSMAENFCFNLLGKFQLSLADLFPPPVIKSVHKEIKIIRLSYDSLKKHEGDYAQAFSVVNIMTENDHLTMTKDGKQYVLKPLSANEFVPFERIKGDSLLRKDSIRYWFRDIDHYHVLFEENATGEAPLGYRLTKFDPKIWMPRNGHYEQFGYQLKAGDSKFLAVDLESTSSHGLMLKLTTSDGVTAIPLQYISTVFAVTGGLSTSFGYTVKFSDNKNFRIVDFAGITFRKKKN